mmetsp:Transcript_94735/g.245180  ORF Transcript_94735/g.245180 Transcript_94735/m.245180 type:complete len:375 (+) Transcript_94735:182-1306(+)
MSQLFQRQRPTAIIVQGSPQPRCVTHKACRFATHGELREIDRAAIVQIEGHIPCVFDGPKLPDQEISEVLQEHLQTLTCPRRVPRRSCQRIWRHLVHDACQVDDVLVPDAVHPTQVPTYAAAIYLLRPHQVKAPGRRSRDHEWEVDGRPATFWQDGQRLFAMRAEESLAQSALERDHAGASHVHGVQADLVHQANAPSDGEANRTEVDCALHLFRRDARYPAVCRDAECHQVRAVCDVSTNLVSLTGQGRKLQCLPRPHVLRQSDYADVPSARGVVLSRAPADDDTAAKHEATTEEVAPQGLLGGEVVWFHPQRMRCSSFKSLAGNTHRQGPHTCAEGVGVRVPLLMLRDLQGPPMIRSRHGIRFGCARSTALY